jgi:sterol desaturase/sphingolipid hydroxylase (fatty acid hydroxylase superfamily)
MLDWLGVWADGSWNWVAIVLFLGLAAWETVKPARRLDRSAALRWFTHISFHAINTSIVAVLGPAALVEALIRNIGIPPGPFALLEKADDYWALIIGLLLLDLYAYAIHRVQHQVFVLWRFHAVHHADVDMDASTTFRHHPAEVLTIALIGAVAFSLLGVPEWIFPVYALVAIVVSLVQHVNAGEVGKLDHALQWILVTPGMHRIHHSADAADGGTNFGMVLSLWDWIFRTYRSEPEAGRAAMAYGVEPYTASEFARTRWAWLLPFAIRPASATTSVGHAD